MPSETSALTLIKYYPTLVKSPVETEYYPVKLVNETNAGSDAPDANVEV
jgi:hypothetical protein